VRSCVGSDPNPLFESRDYGKRPKSLPQWGLTLSRKKLAPLAQDCSFNAVVAALESCNGCAGSSGVFGAATVSQVVG
jgi:hypothetical protein